MVTEADALRFTTIGPAHAPVLSALHGHGFDPGWTASSFMSLLVTPGAYGLIAMGEDDEPKGFILWRSITDEADLITVVTHRDYRGQGVAGALLQRSCHLLKEAGVCTFHLEVAVDNHAALRLYKASGFLETGRRPKYYKTPDGAIDALAMSLQTTPEA